MHGIGLAAAAPAVLLVGAMAPTMADAAGLDALTTDLFPDTVETIRDWATRFALWIQEGYVQAPAVMIGLSALVILPAIAPLGLLLRRKPQPYHATTPQEVPVVPLREGWLEVENAAGTRHPIGRSLFRIGRQDDNDLCLDDRSVHRYHAVLYRSPETGFMIMDVGGQEGNGVKVNDEAVKQAPLKSGDSVSIGQVRLRFRTADA